MATGNTNAIPTYGEVGIMIEQPIRNIATLSATTENIRANFNYFNNRTYGLQCISLYANVEIDQYEYSEMHINAVIFYDSLCFISFVTNGHITNRINYSFERGDTDVLRLLSYLTSRTQNQSTNIIFSGDNVSFNMAIDERNGVLDVTITGSASPNDFCQYNFLMTPTPTYLGKSFYEW